MTMTKITKLKVDCACDEWNNGL